MVWKDDDKQIESTQAKKERAILQAQADVLREFMEESGKPVAPITPGVGKPVASREQLEEITEREASRSQAGSDQELFRLMLEAARNNPFLG